MRRALRVHPVAEAEVLEAAIFLNEQTPGAGDNFIAAIGGTLRSARRTPRIGQLSPTKRTKAEIRRMRVRPNEYQVVYVVRDDHILVVAVAHNMREPLYWRDLVPT